MEKLERTWWTHSSRERGGWRWWLQSNKSGSSILNAEASWRGYGLKGLWLGRNDEGKWHVAIGLHWLYLSLGWRRPGAKYTGYGSGREISLTAGDWSIRWRLWADPDCWESSRPRWRDGSWNVQDTFLGRSVCTTRTVEERDVLVPMPEKSYPARAKLEEFTWKRPRWFAKRMLRASFDIPGGIPHAGKGENSWDCGDDATFGMTTGECRSIAEGVGVLVGSCLRTRVKHGGWDDWSWKREAA